MDDWRVGDECSVQVVSMWRDGRITKIQGDDAWVSVRMPGGRYPVIRHLTSLRRKGDD